MNAPRPEKPLASPVELSPSAVYIRANREKQVFEALTDDWQPVSAISKKLGIGIGQTSFYLLRFTALKRAEFKTEKQAGYHFQLRSVFRRAQSKVLGD